MEGRDERALNSSKSRTLWSLSCERAASEAFPAVPVPAEIDREARADQPELYFGVDELLSLLQPIDADGPAAIRLLRGSWLLDRAAALLLPCIVHCCHAYMLTYMC